MERERGVVVKLVQPVSFDRAYLQMLSDRMWAEDLAAQAESVYEQAERERVVAMTKRGAHQDYIPAVTDTVICRDVGDLELRAYAGVAANRAVEEWAANQEMILQERGHFAGVRFIEVTQLRWHKRVWWWLLNWMGWL